MAFCWSWVCVLLLWIATGKLRTLCDADHLELAKPLLVVPDKNTKQTMPLAVAVAVAVAVAIGADVVT